MQVQQLVGEALERLAEPDPAAVYGSLTPRWRLDSQTWRRGTAVAPIPRARTTRSRVCGADLDPARAAQTASTALPGDFTTTPSGRATASLKNSAPPQSLVTSRGMSTFRTTEPGRRRRYASGSSN